MGLLDKLSRRSENSDAKDTNPAPLFSPYLEPTVISRAIAERENHLSKAVKIPLSDVVLTSGSLMQLAPTLKALVSGNKIGNGSLVRVVFPSGVKGSLAMDKNGMALGSILKKGGGLSQARLTAVDPTSLAAPGRYGCSPYGNQ